MKKKSVTQSDLTKKFSSEMIEDAKLNFLVGGDGDGSQHAPPDPWKP